MQSKAWPTFFPVLRPIQGRYIGSSFYQDFNMLWLKKEVRLQQKQHLHEFRKCQSIQPTWQRRYALRRIMTVSFGYLPSELGTTLRCPFNQLSSYLFSSEQLWHLFTCFTGYNHAILRMPKNPIRWKSKHIKEEV